MRITDWLKNAVKMEGDNGGGSGGGMDNFVDDIIANQDGGGDDSGGQQQQKGQAQGQGAGQQQQGKADDSVAGGGDAAAELRKAAQELSGVAGQFRGQGQQQQQTPPTQEEINEYWGIFDPEKADKDFFGKFLRLPPDLTPEERAQAVGSFKEVWNVMQKGLVTQAIKGALNYIQRDHLGPLKEQFAPLQQYVQKQQGESLQQRFYSAFPALGEKSEQGQVKYSKIIAASARLLADSGRTFKTEEEYFKALADSAAETIKGVLPDFDLGSVPQTQQTQTVTKPRLPRTSAGGTGGTSGNGRGQQQQKGTTGDDSDGLDFMTGAAFRSGG